jgi:hypothetical protein
MCRRVQDLGFTGAQRPCLDKGPPKAYVLKHPRLWCYWEVVKLLRGGCLVGGLRSLGVLSLKRIVSHLPVMR